MEEVKYTGGTITKADPLLGEFMRYCVEHKDLRFWQALKNWAKVEAVMLWKPERKGTCMMDYERAFADMGLKDSFYFE